MKAGRAIELRDRWLKKRYLGYIRVFSKMRDKRLESIQSVKEYYLKRSKAIVMSALRRNASLSREKDAGIRKALQFQVVKSNRYFLLLVAFRALKTWPRLTQSKRQKKELLIYRFKLRKAFKSIRKSVSSLIEQQKRLI